MLKLSEVINAIDSANYETLYYYDPTENNIIVKYDDDIDEEMGDNCIMLPSVYQINEYSIMRQFIETIEDVTLYNQLIISIQGKGAFRRFKDTCINYNIIDKWYKFKEKEYKKIAINWCLGNDIKYIDD